MDRYEDEDTIYNAAMDCSDLFQQWLESLESASSDYELAEDLRGRFNLWSAYVGAFASPKTSLDARLVEHQDIKDMVLELLNMVKQNLRHKLETKHSIAIAHVESTQATSEDLPLLLGSNAIKEAVSRLHSLGIAIRRSAAKGQRQKKSNDSSKQDEENCYLNFVRYKFPHAKQSLVDQLGKSIHLRGRLMFYQQRHNRKIAEVRNRNNQAQSKVKKSIEEPVESAEPQMVVALHPSIQTDQHVPMSETNYSEINKQDFLIRMSQPRPSYSHISRGSSVRENQDEKFGHPKKPKAESGHPNVSCPVCFEPLESASLTEKEWKAHIDRDIEPYVCISEECQDPLQFFVHLRDWKNHMQRKHTLDWAQSIHTMTWYCEMDHSGDDADRKTFDNKADFMQHLFATHGGTITRPQILAKARRNKTITIREPFTCPLCDCCPEEVMPRLAEKPYELLSTHIARHLKALAFFSLSYIDYEEDDSSLSGTRSRTDWTGGVANSHATRLNPHYGIFDDIPPTVFEDIAVSVDGLQFDITPELEDPIVWPDKLSNVNSGHDKTLERFAAAFMLAAARDRTSSSVASLGHESKHDGDEPLFDDSDAFQLPSLPELPPTSSSAHLATSKSIKAANVHRWLDSTDRFAVEMSLFWQKTVQEFLSSKGNLGTAENINDDVVVALIDDGVDRLDPALSDRVLEGKSFDYHDGKLRPSFSSAKGHGTVMASMILRTCPMAKVYPIRFRTFSDSRGRSMIDEKYVAQAILAALNKKANIISMSWTLPMFEDKSDSKDRLHEALKKAVDSKALMFCSAPDGGKFTKLDYPSGPWREDFFRIGAARAHDTIFRWMSEDDITYVLPGVEVLRDQVRSSSFDLASARFTKRVESFQYETGSGVATALAAGLAAMVIYCIKTSIMNMKIMNQNKDPILGSAIGDNDANLIAAPDAMKRAFARLGNVTPDKFIQVWEKFDGISETLETFRRDGSSPEEKVKCIKRFVEFGSELAIAIEA